MDPGVVTSSLRHLLDTNVLVYAHDGADAEKQARATEVLSRWRHSSARFRSCR
jgi:predicted nucleic acid-binding protein